MTQKTAGADDREKPVTSLRLFVNRLTTAIRNRTEMYGHDDPLQKVCKDPADREGYRGITEIIPELSSYKARQYGHLKSQASEAGCSDLTEYCAYLRGHPEEVTRLKSNLTFLGSHFFRGSDWGYFNEACLKAFEGRENVRVWCAGCSSGQEVYSTVLSLLDHVPLRAIEVLATDYNEELLKKTRAGQYFNMHLHEIPEAYRRYVIEGEKKFEFRPEIRERITAGYLNLLTDPFPEGFDVIICRNVLKFFKGDVIREIQKKLAASLNEGGFVFLSTDDNSKTAELIINPGRLGLKQMANKSIYRKIV